MDNTNNDQHVQHGLDDNPKGDAGKGAALGAIGGAVVGALAGGPIGAIVGAIAGGAASGAAVAVVDTVDDDNTVSGISSENATATEQGSGAQSHLTDAKPVASNPGSDTSLTRNTPTQENPLMADNTSNTATDPTVRVGTYGTGMNQRPVTRAEYDAMSDNDRMTVVLMAEHLNVSKGARQAGEVEVSTRVVEEQVQVPVTLKHEEVTVTRRAVDQPLDASMVKNGEVFTNQTIKVPVHEEIAHVTKEARVAEEIEIERKVVSQDKTISETVRHEEIDINAPQNVRLSDSGETR